tara:strand:+ start:1647 stop:2336 length:690 start_codon:yes stop_codon:yes gene_type:complete
MKYWTKHQARAAQTTEADQLNAELRASQSAITTLDRTQTPQLSYTTSNIKPYAMHQMWASGDNTGPLWGSSTTKGEQTNVRASATNTRGDQFRAITYQEYSGGWETAFTQTLTGFRGGHLHIEWSGQAAIFPAFQQTQNNNHPPNSKRMRLRIQVAGVTTVERLGTARSMSSFRIFGGGLYPQGDLQLEYQWRFTPAGQDDAIAEGSPVKHIMQAHVFGCKVLAIARYR